jgi:hypothetical protein
MFKITFLIFCFIVSSSFLFADDLIFPADVPVTTAETSDPELRSLEWNRYVNKNFVILSIDDSQGLWLCKNVPNLNEWCVSRWGFTPKKLSKECRIFCVPNNSLLKKLFGLDSPKVEIRKDKDGKTEIMAMWFVLDETRTTPFLPQSLTRVGFSDFSEQSSYVIPFWFLRSAELINSSSKSSFKNAAEVFEKNEYKNVSLLSCKELLSTDIKGYQAMPSSKKDCFDSQSIVLCMMLRKEFGESKLHYFLSLLQSKDLSLALKDSYGYENLEDFEKKYLMYYRDFSKDLFQDKVPNSYFEVKSVKN